MRNYISHPLTKALPARNGRAIIESSIAYQIKLLEMPCQVIGHMLGRLVEPIV